MEAEKDTEKRIRNLEERVAYLESKLEMSVEDERFKRKVRKLFPQNECEVSKNKMGQRVATGEVDPHRLPKIANRVDEMDNLGWRVSHLGEDMVEISIESGLVSY